MDWQSHVLHILRLARQTWWIQYNKPTLHLDTLLHRVRPRAYIWDHFHTLFTNSSFQKPVVCLLLLPAPVTQPASTKTPPLLQLPAGYKPKPSPNAVLNRYSGRILDRMIGYIWWLLTFIGAGNTAVGIFNFFLGIGAWSWWKSSATSPWDHYL